LILGSLTDGEIPGAIMSDKKSASSVQSEAVKFDSIKTIDDDQEVENFSEDSDVEVEVK
jgi:hypothetical protein